jgi:hypothetical protein
MSFIYINYKNRRFMTQPCNDSLLWSVKWWRLKYIHIAVICIMLCSRPLLHTVSQWIRNIKWQMYSCACQCWHAVCCYSLLLTLPTLLIFFTYSLEMGQEYEVWPENSVTVSGIPRGRGVWGVFKPPKILKFWQRWAEFPIPCKIHL